MVGGVLQDMLLLDRMNELDISDPLYAFALDELLCRRTGLEGQPVCHIWRHPQAFVLGSKDRRLPFAREATDWLESNGWPVAVRNSGGAAVPLDGGVVNVSLILPNSDARHVGYQGDFETMYELIGEALRGTGRLVEKGLIHGAYCPGDYDLSIDGRKFCGIAQRRQVHATVIQAFVVAEGSGRLRAEFVRSFYDIASGGDDALGHPLVAGDSTASLEELAGMGPMAAFSFAAAIKAVVGESSMLTAGLCDPILPQPDEVQAMADVMRARYAD